MFCFLSSSVWKFCSSPVFLFKKKVILFPYLWLCGVFAAAWAFLWSQSAGFMLRWLHLAAVSSPCSGVLLQSTSFGVRGLQELRFSGSRTQVQKLWCMFATSISYRQFKKSLQPCQQVYGNIRLMIQKTSLYVFIGSGGVKLATPKCVFLV